MLQPREILVRAPNWLGDHVMAQGFYEALKQVFPQSKKVCLLPQGLEGLFSSKFFDEEWTFVKSDLKEKVKARLLAQKIQSRNFDLSFSLTSSWSSALLLYRSHIPRRFGFSQSGSGILLTDSVKWLGRKSGKHKSEIYLDLLDKIVSKLEIKNELIQSNFVSSQAKYWVLAPGAALPLREWPYFPELIFEIRRKYPEQKIRVVGSSAEAVWVSRLKRWKLEGVEDWIGKTSLVELRNLCSQAQLVIANDSGVAHVAATISQAPTLVLFGPGTPDYIVPLGPQVHSLTPGSKVSCAPCEKPYCKSPMGYQKCLKEISVDSVLTKVEEILSL